MRLRLRTPPTTEVLLRRTPQEVVRDFPEALAVFRRHDLDLGAFGARPLARLVADAVPSDAGKLVPDIRRALEWRLEE